jgi:release factor glutamine methyltransferase
MKRTKSLPPKIYEQFLTHLTGLSREKLFSTEPKLTILQKFKLSGFIKKYSSGKPLQYILNQASFFTLDFYVNKNVLIPRPETEILVEKAIKRIRKMSESSSRTLNVVDVGTGSGIIAIGLLSRLSEVEKSGVEVFGTDLSAKALTVAKINSLRHNVRLKLYNCDLISHRELPKKFDLILANLPYLPSGYESYNRSLLLEPRLALDGGQDGLNVIKRLLHCLKDRLDPDGLAILEIDPSQSNKIRKIIGEGFSISIIKDLNYYDRFVEIKKSLKSR